MQTGVADVITTSALWALIAIGATLSESVDLLRV
jgi:hypothetical protein